MINYQVWVSTGGAYYLLITGFSSTTLNVVSLTAGTTYSFVIKEQTAWGFSAFSSALSLLCATAPNAPSAPTTTVTGN